MTKLFSTLIAVLIAGWCLVGAATSASASYRHHDCCGPIRPTYVYHTAHKSIHVTRYRDELRTNYVYRQHRIVHVTRVQPTIYVHTVVRIHHHTVGIVRPVYVHTTEYLPPRRIMTSSVVSTYDCVCTYGHRRHCR